MLNFPTGGNPKGRLDKKNSNFFSFFSQWLLAYKKGEWSFTFGGNLTITGFWRWLTIATLTGSVIYVATNQQLVIIFIVKVTNLFN